MANYENKVVGYLVFTDGSFSIHTNCDPSFASSEPRQEFWCKECAEPCYKTVAVDPSLTPVYRVNIGIYSQVCDACGKIVVDGVKKADKKSPLCLFGLATLRN